jgi:hypothetical protein
MRQNPRQWSKSESQNTAVGLEGHVKNYLVFCVSISEFFKIPIAVLQKQQRTL